MIKEIIVSSGQAEILVLMNIALCLMFYIMNALTVLYINNESEPKLKKKKHVSLFSTDVVKDSLLVYLMWDPYFSYLHFRPTSLWDASQD